MRDLRAGLILAEEPQQCNESVSGPFDADHESESPAAFLQT